jgi:hypothetical protein
MLHGKDQCQALCHILIDSVTYKVFPQMKGYTCEQLMFLLELIKMS